MLPPPTRGENRYRLYSEETVEVLGFIKQAPRLGLTLGEIKEIISIRQGGRPPCAHVYRLLRKRARVRGLEERSESRLLPLFKRRTETVGQWLPELYPHGLAAGAHRSVRPSVVEVRAEDDA